jgi:chromosome segregation ATPase
MSTAGKVLTVLVLLLAPIWMFLMATVAQLNTNWTEAIDARDKDIAKLEEQVKTNEREIQALKDQVASQQDTTERTSAVLRSQVAEVERQRAEAIEIQTRVASQVETINAALKNAEAARELRKTELANEQTAKKQFEDEVEKLKGENTALLDELTNLRNDFKETLESNRALKERLIKGGQTPKPVRRSSFAR